MLQKSRIFNNCENNVLLKNTLAFWNSCDKNCWVKLTPGDPEWKLRGLQPRADVVRCRLGCVLVPEKEANFASSLHSNTIKGLKMLEILTTFVRTQTYLSPV